MTHRAETIVSTIKTRLTGLTTTGTRVYRGRVVPLAANELPALCVFQGEDEVVDQYTQDKIDNRLTIIVEAKVKSPTAQLDTTLNQIRKEVTIALQADYTQGLAYVIDTFEGNVERPELSGEGDQPIGSMRMEWRFKYRRSRTDPSAS